MDENFPNQIELFKSVFKDREDVFAVRWQKGNKSGYTPAYFYDPYMYRAEIFSRIFQDAVKCIWERITSQKLI